MRGIRATRLVFDQHAFHTLAGHIRRARSKTNVTLALSVFIRTVGSSAYEESGEGNSAEKSSEHRFCFVETNA
jgi:hypothetical protein